MKAQTNKSLRCLHNVIHVVPFNAFSYNTHLILYLYLSLSIIVLFLPNEGFPFYSSRVKVCEMFLNLSMLLHAI